MIERVDEIKANLENVHSELNEAAASCGRRPEDVRLMAVSKTKPVEDILAAYEAGHRLFGENRINEAAEKFAGLPPDAELHMIGHLQSNKAKTAAGCATCVQSIDKLSTAEALDKRAFEEGKKIDILIEINKSGEQTKSGYPDFDTFYSELDSFLRLENLRLRGLMTIAPFTDNEEDIRRAFASLYNDFISLQNRSGLDAIDTLSMGMSSDFRIAVEEGSTLVRIGTAIFGSRIV